MTKNPIDPIDLSNLNPAQAEAVRCTQGPLLVLAGAGSGKTRVLTTRIAYMIAASEVYPWQVLAITFTNKAAAEMRGRLEALLGEDIRGMWIATFHAMCVRMLREDPELVGYTRNFSILDEADSRRLIRDIMADLEMDPKRFNERSLREKISSAKNALEEADVLESSNNPADRAAARVWREYERRCLRAGSLDFDDLLVLCHRLLSRHETVRQRWQNRFLRINVDEYQDTNHAQYAIVKLLADAHHNIMAVGDDDQSIYGWRGADIKNILSFEKDYPEARVVRLEQNYRSTSFILNAANAVVAKNRGRKKKRLFTTAGKGEKIGCYRASDERDEGRWIAGEIERLAATGAAVPYADMAIFYRTNAQSRVLEDMLMRAGVPYRLVGGTRFFDRAEIRDLLAYLRLCANPNDDISAMRVINVPRRGIGKTSLDKLKKLSYDREISLIEAARQARGIPGLLSAKLKEACRDFVACIEECRAVSGDLSDVVEAVIERSGLVRGLKAQQTLEADGRIENIKEFVSVAAEFEESYAEPAEDEENEPAKPETVPTSPTLPDFLEWLALRTDLDAITEEKDAVTLMTIHSSKGLEFGTVFVAGMEEGLFPHAAHRESPAELEEERRLAYVAITRARRRLYLTCAETRMIFGKRSAAAPSRFLEDVPKDCIRQLGVGSRGYSGVGWDKRGDRHGTFGSGIIGTPIGTPHGNTTAAGSKNASFAPGDRVRHKKFGQGIVLEASGDKITVRFDNSGKKTLLASLAPISKLS